MKVLFLGLILLFTKVMMADATIPSTDIKGAKDLPYIGRYEGAKIVAYQHRKFDRFTLPLAALKAVEGKRDGHNNIFFSPQKSKILEGEHTRLVYILPAERTPLEILKNYEDEITSKGGKILFECDKGECGGDPGRACGGGGGNMSLAMFMQSEEDVNAYNEAFSNGYCALTSRINDQHYLSAELPEQDAFLSVLTYRVSDDSFCKAFHNRTVAVIDALQVKQREQKMVVIKADEMNKKIEGEGKIALYGIYFDTDKSVVKKESKPTLDEIAKMLKENPDLHILIVGHTDNQGAFQYNQKLSQRRANAVVEKLVKGYKISSKRLKSVGVSYACPAASNATDHGRAKNRRVVLVKDNKE
ncbi:OmpA family protein [Sulfurovum sp.]|uniref:OmpA family protein n=1 Tax=Sulfurovum sp. TaxID=1969726 RepID=UPI0025E39387|nr:OmpA family protein [Sulfurovum sp.]